MYIYSIKNKVNNKMYIGSTVDFSRRKRQHLHDLRHNKHNNNHLQKSFNKYGEDNFIFSIVEKTDCLEKLILLEKEHIIKNNTHDDSVGYNKNIITDRNIPSKETIQKIVTTRRKNNPNWHPPDISDRIKKSLEGLDLSHDEKTKVKISQTMKIIVKNRDKSSYAKMAATKKGMKMPSAATKIICIENNTIYDSIKDASKVLNISKVLISRVINGHAAKAKNFTFKKI